MKYIRTGTGVVAVLEGTQKCWEYSIKQGGFIPCDFEGIRQLYLGGVAKECTETDFRNDIVQKTNSLVVWTQKAESLARERHAGKTEKAGEDYFQCHITEVVNRVRKLFGGGYLPIIAYLHDILEDTDTTRTELRENFPKEVVDAVDALTRRKGELYIDYIQRIKKDPLAVKVKICDLTHNMDLSRLPVITENDMRRYKKYADALVMLTK